MSFARFISVLFFCIWSSCVDNNNLGMSIIFPEGLSESQKTNQYEDLYNTKRDDIFSCPKTHKYAYSNGKWCCRANKDCNHNDLTQNSICCEYSAFKECPGQKSGRVCKNHKKGKNIRAGSNAIDSTETTEEGDRGVKGIKNEVKDSIGSIGQKGEIEDREKENDFNSHDDDCLRDKGLTNFTSSTAMEKNGWVFSNCMRHKPTELNKTCGNSSTWYGSGANCRSSLTANFTGSGTAILSFGNCKDTGMVIFKKSDISGKGFVDAAEGNNMSREIKFQYLPNQFIELISFDNAVIKLNFLQINCTTYNM